MKEKGLFVLISVMLLTACAPIEHDPQLATLSDDSAASWGVTPLPVNKRPDTKEEPMQANLVPGDAMPMSGCFESECHQKMLVSAGQYLHQPFAEGLCEPCHRMPEDHSVNNEPHQASQSDIDICLECHEESDLGRSHPVDEDRIDPLTGELFTCTSSCHDPHSAPYVYLLRFPGGGTLCVRCHKEFE